MFTHQNFVKIQRENNYGDLKVVVCGGMLIFMCRLIESDLIFVLSFSSLFDFSM